MRHGFVKVAAITPNIKVADCEYNVNEIIHQIEEAKQKGAKVIVCPELCITGYTCEDLFLQNTLLTGALEGLNKLIDFSKDIDALIAVGMPFLKDGKLFNVAAVLYQGELLGVVPKRYIPNYSEFYEARYFGNGNDIVEYVTINHKKVPFGCKLIFSHKEIPNLKVGIEICEDLWVPQPPSGGLCQAGATVILNLSASNETTGKDIYRKTLVSNQSARLVCGYLYSSAGEGESTTDLVFSGHNMIAENGTVIAESERFVNGVLVSEIDLEKLISERRRISTYLVEEKKEYTYLEYGEYATENKSTYDSTLSLTRFIDKSPFVPTKREEREKRCNEIIHIQALGLKKRLQHTGCNSVVLGISGGLDSTLALLVTRRAFDMLELDPKGIVAVTMPCFGTTDRTYQNAILLVQELSATLREIRINEAVELHFRDINHDINKHDVTFENGQARERTQVLMDIANQVNGFVVGTGDMSELALGWATYNGDHMSMYGVNASVPKTLVRYLVAYFAEDAKSNTLRNVLKDVLDTPVSPELLPPKDGEIVQKTEDVVGPYELHDFFLYYVLRFGFTPSKIYRLAVYAFHGDYTKETIYRWLTTFYRRFFQQQYKRSCLPDGPKVGSVAVSPRGDLRMPSDASVSLWMRDLESILR
ncbi:NAD(+) synthase [Lachnoclostridium sp.]|nr:NAD(+) synthase [Lachnoclostridium sp.]